MNIIKVREDLTNPNPHYADLYRAIGERPHIANWLEILEKFQSKPLVLELGCGSGGLAIPLARQGYEVWGVDADPHMLEIAQETTISTLHFIQSRVEDINLPLKFQLVLLSSHFINNMLNLTDRQTIYKVAVQHLAEDGILAFEIDYPEWHFTAQDLEATGLRLEQIHFDSLQKKWIGTEHYYKIRVKCHSFDPNTKHWIGLVEYEFDDVTYQYYFTSQIITVEEIVNELQPFGLTISSPPIKRNETDLEVLFTFND